MRPIWPYLLETSFYQIGRKHVPGIKMKEDQVSHKTLYYPI